MLYASNAFTSRMICKENYDFISFFFNSALSSAFDFVMSWNLGGKWTTECFDNILASPAICCIQCKFHKKKWKNHTKNYGWRVRIKFDINIQYIVVGLLSTWGNQLLFSLLSSRTESCEWSVLTLCSSYFTICNNNRENEKRKKYILNPHAKKRFTVLIYFIFQTFN